MFCFWSLRYYFTKEWDVRPENAISPKTWCNASSIVYPCCSVGRMSYVHWFQSTCLTCPSIHESFHNLALVFCWPYQKRKKKRGRCFKWLVPVRSFIVWLRWSRLCFVQVVRCSATARRGLKVWHCFHSLPLRDGTCKVNLACICFPLLAI